jgi:hypothetical protein
MKKTYLMIAAMAITGISNANIIYTDIPDGVPAGIDFNQDATMEFDIGGVMTPGTDINYFLYGLDNNIHAISAAQWDVPDCVSLGFTIDASSNWEGQGDASLDAWGAGNTTVTVGQDEYIAVRFNLGAAAVYYGWIRFELDAAGNYIYKDYAYEDNGGAIDAGDMGATGTVLVTSISIQGTGGASTITTPAGTLQMSETVLPANATNSAVTWTVTNGTGSATISATGLVTATGNGTVTVTATANDGSGIIGNLVVTISNQSTGIQESAANIISIYPNPASDFLQITSNETSNESNKVESLTIYSYNGQAVLKTKIETEGERINISHLSSGAYMLVLASENGNVSTKKWMKK